MGYSTDAITPPANMTNSTIAASDSLLDFDEDGVSLDTDDVSETARSIRCAHANWYHRMVFTSIVVSVDVAMSPPLLPMMVGSTSSTSRSL